MSTDDITGTVLRQIHADLGELKSGFARIETTLPHMDEAIRGLARITVGLVGAVEDIKDRLLALEEQARTP